MSRRGWRSGRSRTPPSSRGRGAPRVSRRWPGTSAAYGRIGGSGRGRGSGVPVEETIAHLWTVRDGKAVALQVYTDPDDALRDARAAGNADQG